MALSTSAGLRERFPALVIGVVECTGVCSSRQFDLFCQMPGVVTRDGREPQLLTARIPPTTLVDVSCLAVGEADSRYIRRLSPSLAHSNIIFWSLASLSRGSADLYSVPAPAPIDEIDNTSVDSMKIAPWLRDYSGILGPYNETTFAKSLAAFSAQKKMGLPPDVLNEGMCSDVSLGSLFERDGICIPRHFFNCKEIALTKPLTGQAPHALVDIRWL